MVTVSDIVYFSFRKIKGKNKIVSEPIISTGISFEIFSNSVISLSPRDSIILWGAAKVFTGLLKIILNIINNTDICNFNLKA